jgi:hypothetical protein
MAKDVKREASRFFHSRAYISCFQHSTCAVLVGQSEHGPRVTGQRGNGSDDAGREVDRAGLSIFRLFDIRDTISEAEILRLEPRRLGEAAAGVE